MSYLREAVEKQRRFLANYLIRVGVYKHDDSELNTKSIAELESEYEKIKSAND